MAKGGMGKNVTQGVTGGQQMPSGRNYISPQGAADLFGGVPMFNMAFQNRANKANQGVSMQPTEPASSTPQTQFNNRNPYQHLYNMKDWFKVMQSQTPTDYFSAMYRAQQPTPAATPTPTPTPSASPQGLLSMQYNPNTGMPI